MAVRPQDFNVSGPDYQPKALANAYDGYEAYSCRNLVVNPSFELSEVIASGMPYFPCSSRVELMVGWDDPTVIVGANPSEHGGTPDYYYKFQGNHEVADGCRWSGVDSGRFAVEPVYTPAGWGNSANAYAGLALWYYRDVPSTLPPPPQSLFNDLRDAREYLMNRLREPLMHGYKYKVRMRVSLGEISVKALPLQVYFTNSPVFSIHPSAINNFSANVIALNNGPQGLVNFSQVITDKNGWHLIEAEIQVPGNPQDGPTDWQYMVIGNFRTFAETQQVAVDVPPSAPWPGYNPNMAYDWSCYYLVDDVEVVPDCGHFDALVGGCVTGDFYYAPDSLPASVAWTQIQNQLPTSWQRLYVDGPIVLDANVHFQNKELVFGPSGRMIVAPGYDLKVENSHLYGCYTMWPGLEVNDATIRFIESQINDARTAIAMNAPRGFGITKSYFNLNTQHIRIENFSQVSSTASNLRFIVGSSFLASPFFKYDPSTGTFPQPPIPVAIDIRNATPFIQIGLPSSGLGNSISKCGVGIRAQGANLRVMRNNFSAIAEAAVRFTNVQQPGGQAVPFKTLLCGNGAIAGQNTFVNCFRGIQIGHSDWSAAYHKVQAFVNKNVFLSPPSATYPMERAIEAAHIYSEPFGGVTSSSILQFENNTIHRAKIAIELLRIGNSTLVISGNTIHHNASQNNTNTQGICYSELLHPPVFCNKLNNTGYGSFSNIRVIKRNRITGYAVGIYTLATPCVVVDSNRISLTPATWWQHHGIWANMDRQIRVLNNRVDGNDLANHWNKLGIRLYATSNARVGCDTTLTLGRAHVYDMHYSSYPLIYRNLLGRYKYGIQVWTGSIGVQSVLPHPTTQQPTPYRNMNLWPINVPGNPHRATIYDIDALDLPVTFYVSQSMAPTTLPGPYDSWFAENPSFNQTGTPTISPNVNIDLSDNHKKITECRECAVCFLDTKVKALYWNTTSNDEADSASTLIAGDSLFWDTPAVKVIKDWLVNGPVANNPEHEFLRQFRLASDVLADSVLSANDTLMSLLENWPEALTLSRIQAFIQERRLEEARALLSQMSPSGKAASLHRDWMDILIRMEEDSLWLEDESLLQRLAHMALLCARDYGLPVLGARALLLHYFPETELRLPACDRPSEAPGEAAPQVSLSGEDCFTLSPQPASGIVNIANSCSRAARMDMRTLDGVLLRSRLLQPNATLSEPLEGLQPGLYVLFFYEAQNGRLLSAEYLIIQ